MCKASDLALGTDSEHGNFNGMSYSGTLLVLRNLSSAACHVAVRPAGALTQLPIKPEIPVGASCIPVR